MAKRFFDITVVLIFLPLWASVLMLIALLVFLDIRSSPFFLQKRGGKDGKVMTIIKFKTMTDERDIHGNLLDDKQRLTKLGSILRKTSLDEIPSLLNVLQGNMSLVGPRPFMAEYLSLYNQEQMRRHDVRPGITGWAQVNGRNALSWEDKFKLDVWYVDNQNFWLDLKILMLTVKKVFVREGISADGEVTMSKFTGSKTK